MSGFDREHRGRFADLLFEKFADWQVILLTHEREWFDSIKDTARGRGWYIGEVKWDKDNGSVFEEK